MKAARIVVLGVALAAGGIAALLAGRSPKAPEVKKVDAPAMATVDVLVAKSDLPMGRAIAPSDVKWEAWPASSAGPSFIRKQDRPNAIESLAGTVARAPFIAGEPIREAKLVNAKGSGFMAAILPTGMRAVSTQISPETSAGGFILPNDHVDIVLTRRDKEAEKATGTETLTSETVLSNIRVLAIDQNVEEKNGQKVVVGKTATLELTPRQVETLTLAQKMGTLSLALRSISDASGDNQPVEDDPNTRRAGVNIVRFGVGTVTTPK